jgi:spore maturation protein CgeB
MIDVLKKQLEDLKDFRQKIEQLIEDALERKIQERGLERCKVTHS